MATLSLNQIFTLKVTAIQDAADSFPQNGTGAMMYCHYYLLTDEMGEEYPAQKCTLEATQNSCGIGDMVKVQVNKLSKGRYTLSSIVPISKATAPHVKMEENYVPPYAGPVGVPTNQSLNPNIAGTILDRSMTLAVTYYKEHGAPFEKVTDIADQFKAWFEKNLQQ